MCRRCTGVWNESPAEVLVVLLDGALPRINYLRCWVTELDCRSPFFHLV
ncbi:unnamed protein product [Amoebophrya sp. A120]|nr:unnamed protein product [Amoebophrya sp. A120]|eukprot:GSA120T00010019001.1